MMEEEEWRGKTINGEACRVEKREPTSLFPILDALAVAGDEQVGGWGPGSWW